MSHVRNKLRARADFLKKISTFFAERDVLKVDIPCLGRTAGLDLHIEPMQVEGQYWLQTSPEYYMKRLLAQGSGSIYALGSAFRHDEIGRYHAMEFTLLEWYQVGLDHHGLMRVLDALVQTLLAVPSAEKITYQALFEAHLGCDPHTVSLSQLRDTVTAQTGMAEAHRLTQDDCLTLLLSHCIEPTLGQTRPVFVYDFPASQAALARVNHGVAERFELYYQGVELANGYHELNDATEQAVRFEQESRLRAEQNKKSVPIDKTLLACLDSLPDCAGVAVGVDRLLMLKENKERLSEVRLFNDLD